MHHHSKREVNLMMGHVHALETSLVCSYPYDGQCPTYNNFFHMSNIVLNYVRGFLTFEIFIYQHMIPVVFNTIVFNYSSNYLSQNRMRNNPFDAGEWNKPRLKFIVISVTFFCTFLKIIYFMFKIY